MVLYGQRNFAEGKTFLSAAPHRLRGGKCAVTPCTSRRAAFGSKVLSFHPFLKTRNVWCSYQKVSLFEIPPLSCKWEESGKEGCQSDLRDFSEKMNTNLNTEKKVKYNNLWVTTSAEAGVEFTRTGGLESLPWATRSSFKGQERPQNLFLILQKSFEIWHSSQKSVERKKKKKAHVLTSASNWKTDLLLFNGFHRCSDPRCAVRIS